MDHDRTTPDARIAGHAGPAPRTTPGTGRGASFRRAGVVAVVACAVTGSALGLGAAGAFATDAAAPSSEQVAADAAAQAAGTTEGTAAAPKITYDAADLAAFAASPYADDALNLAVVWGTPDLVTAQGKAGAAIAAGTPLPFGPDDAPSASYTDDQRLEAFFLAGSSWPQALGLAVAWGEPSIYTVKTTIGGTLLAHEQVLAAPATFTEDQQVAAFSAGGYTEANAVQLAETWQSGSVREAQARAGAALLAGETLPVAP